MAQPGCSSCSHARACTHTCTHTHRRKVWVNRTPPPSKENKTSHLLLATVLVQASHTPTPHIYTHMHTCRIQLHFLPYHTPCPTTTPPTSVYTCPLPFTTHLPRSLSLPRFAIPYSALNHREHQSWMSVLSRWTPGHIKASWEFPAGGW